jgi:hypothetical protein
MHFSIVLLGKITSPNSFNIHIFLERRTLLLTRYFEVAYRNEEPFVDGRIDRCRRLVIALRNMRSSMLINPVRRIGNSKIHPTGQTQIKGTIGEGTYLHPEEVEFFR